jgi:predicted Fe-Mo cluster-binding NifX family protein
VSLIAIPVWQGLVATTLDFAASFLLVQVEGGKKTESREVSLVTAPPEVLGRRLQEWSAETVICGAISRWLWQDLETRGIRVIPFVSGQAGEVLQAFMDGRLDDSRFLMAGCPLGARRAWKCRGHRGGRRQA